MNANKPFDSGLNEASKKGDIKTVQMALKNGVDADCLASKWSSEDDMRPIHYAGLATYLRLDLSQSNDDKNVCFFSIYIYVVREWWWWWYICISDTELYDNVLHQWWLFIYINTAYYNYADITSELLAAGAVVNRKQGVWLSRMHTHAHTHTYTQRTLWPCYYRHEIIQPIQYTTENV